MKRLIVFVGLVLFSGTVLAQNNTTPALAANFMWGNHVNSFIGNGTQFWFVGNVTAGRSYCVETGQYDFPYGDRFADTIVDVFRQDQTTLLVHNDDTPQEPSGRNFSRACWVPTVSENNYVELTNFSTNTSSVTLRFVETTLYCPWFFIAGDYNAFSLIQNTTSSTVSNVVVTWRGLNGSVAGTTTVSIPGHGGIVLNAATFVNNAVFANGTIEVAYPGAPDQLVGSTTTLSGTTGLGFDAQFSQRKPW